MNRWKIHTAIFMIPVLILCAFPSLSAMAATTKEKLEQAKQEKEAIEGKIDENEEKLSGLNDKKDTLSTELTGLNNNLTEISNNLADLEAQIAAKEAEIEATTALLEEAIMTANNQYEAMKTRIRFMYETGNTTYMEMLLNANGFSDMLNAAEYIEQLTAYDRKKLEEYKDVRNSIQELQEQEICEKEELDGLRAEVESEQGRVAGLVSQTRSNISATESDIAAAEAAALAYEAELKAKENDIAALQKQLAEEQRLSQLSANSVWRDISEVSFAEGDRYLLANLIYCEAGGEPYDGKVAVGAVVINRVLSPVYPSTVEGVIYAPRQFSPAGSGRLAVALSANLATDACYRAADEAMSGVTNVGNCVYFRTPIEGLSGIQIGGHIFY